MRGAEWVEKSGPELLRLAEVEGLPRAWAESLARDWLLFLSRCVGEGDFGEFTWTLPLVMERGVLRDLG